MSHRSGYNRTYVTSVRLLRITLATRAATAPWFAAGGCRGLPGKTGLGHLEPSHIFTRPGAGFRASPVPYAKSENVRPARRLTIEAAVNL
jgi:hypothetical protein